MSYHCCCSFYGCHSLTNDVVVVVVVINVAVAFFINDVAVVSVVVIDVLQLMSLLLHFLPLLL